MAELNSANEENENEGANRLVNNSQRTDIGKVKNDIDYARLLDNAKNWKSYFKKSDFFKGLILGVGPSAADIATDFLWAGKQWDQGRHHYMMIGHYEVLFSWAGNSWVFISLPGIILAFNWIRNYLSQVCPHPREGCRNMCVCLGHTTTFIGILGSITLIYFLLFVLPSFFFYAAILVATFILSVKTLSLFLHSDEMKKFSTKISAAEGLFESSLQLLLVSILWMQKSSDVPLMYLAMASSVTMVGKAAAEQFLVFGETNLLEIGTVRQILKYTPVFSFTAIFRIGSFSVLFGWAGNGSHIWLISLAPVVALPILVLLVLKMCGKFRSLSPVDLVLAVLGEFSTSTILGQEGREGSRAFQAAMSVWMFLVYSSGLVWVMVSPDLHHLGWRFATNPYPICGCLLAFGVISQCLFWWQIFFIDKFNIMYKLNTLSLV